MLYTDEARNGGGGVRVRGAVTTTTEVSDNDGDQQCLVRGGENGGACGEVIIFLLACFVFVAMFIRLRSNCKAWLY